MSPSLSLRTIAARALGAALLAAASTGAAAQSALVIGNGAYAELPDIPGANADAAAFAALFRAKGYTVVEAQNADLRGMLTAISAFIDGLERGEKAVVVYAGHGWSDGVGNYLLPTDTPERGDPILVKRLSIPLRNGVDGLLDQVAARRPGLHVAIIDACRDNPFTPALSTRSVAQTRGLARIDPPQGAFVIYSAGAGQTALDTLGGGDPVKNSVFTRTILPLLEKNFYLESAMNEVSLAVPALAARIGHRQNPAYYDEAPGYACLVDACVTDDEPVKVAAPAPKPEPEPKPAVVIRLGVERPPIEADSVEAALAKLEALAEAGDVNAMRDLGLIFGDPENAVHDAAKALAWFERAGAEDDPIALFRAGRAYHLGEGAAPDRAKAATFYERAAAAGSPDAMNNLAILLITGDGAAPDAERGLALLERAAEAGHARAAYNVAAIYDDGDVAAADPDKAARFMILAIAHGGEAARDAMLAGAKEWTTAFRSAFQRALAEQSTDPGAPDGVIGRRSRLSIEALFGRDAKR